MAASQVPGESQSSSRQVLLIVLSVLLMVATTLGISFRLYSRLFVLRKGFAEDVLMVLGAIFAFGLSVVFTLGAFHGFGSPEDGHRSASDVTILYDLLFASSYTYAAATLFIKFSFLMLYLRIDERKPMRWTVYTLMSVIVGQFFTMVVVMSVSYVSPSKLVQWRGSLHSLPIQPAAAQAFWNGMDIVSAASALAVYVAPFFILRGLQLPMKWAVTALLALGVLPVAASCIKTYYIWRLFTSRDVYYKIVDAAIWTQVEVHLAILCGSVQTYRILLRGVCPRCPDDGCTTDPEPASFLSNQRRAYSPAGTFDSWAPWQRSISEVSEAHLKAGISRTPSPTGNNGVAILRPGARPQFPNIATRIRCDNNTNMWWFQAAVDKSFGSPWPSNH